MRIFSRVLKMRAFFHICPTPKTCTHDACGDLAFLFLSIFGICELCTVVLQDLHPSIVKCKHILKDSMTFL
jgi:hypothetical protein